MLFTDKKTQKVNCFACREAIKIFNDILFVVWAKAQMTHEPRHCDDDFYFGGCMVQMCGDHHSLHYHQSFFVSFHFSTLFLRFNHILRLLIIRYHLV